MGVLWISSDKYDQMGKKIKSQNIPRASNKTQNKTLDQKLTLKKSHAKFPSLQIFQKYSPNFPTKKNYGNENFKPKKSSISLSLEIWSTPPPPGFLDLDVWLHVHLTKSSPRFFFGGGNSIEGACCQNMQSVGNNLSFVLDV